MAEEKTSHKEIIEKIKPELDKVINFLERELQKTKASRASSSLVENIEVECFGQKFPLKQLSAISIPEPRQILIQPWDSSYIESIVKALEKTGIGASPIVDKNLIRINLPTFSEEFRKDLIRLVSEKKEQAKQTIRRWREEAWDEIQEKFREGKIGEDDKYNGKDELQELVDEYNKKIEELSEKKRKEILE
jgi:ribosome recycling factor